MSQLVGEEVWSCKKSQNTIFWLGDVETKLPCGGLVGLVTILAACCVRTTWGIDTF